MTGKKRAVFCVFLLLFLFAFSRSGVSEAAEAPEAYSRVGEFTQELLDKFQARFESFEDRIYKYALNLFYLLFLCQFAWAVIQLILSESATLTAVAVTVARQALTGGFFYWLLFDRTVLKTIIASFRTMAASTLSFSDLLFFVESSVCNIMTAIQLKGGFSLQGIALFLAGLVACTIMSFVLTSAIGFLAIVMLENYIVGSLGLILLGFGGSEFTRNYALSYIRALVHIGFKLFLVTVVLFVGTYAFQQLTGGILRTAKDISNASLIELCFVLIGQCFLFLAMIKVIPQIADSLIGGVSMSTGQGLGAVRGGAAAAAGTLAALGGFVLRAPGRAANVATGGRNTVEYAANAWSSAYNRHRAAGLGSVRAGFSASVGALGSTAWEMYQSAYQGRPVRQSAFPQNTMSASGSGSGHQGSAGGQGAGESGRTSGSGSGQGDMNDQGAASPASGADTSGDAAADKYGTSGGGFAERSGHGSTGSGDYSSMTRDPAAESSLDIGNTPQARRNEKQKRSSGKSADPATDPEYLAKRFKTWD